MTTVEKWTPPALQQLLNADPEHAEIVEAAYWAGARAARPFIGIDPAMCSGQPTVNHTRLSVDAVTGMVWAGESVDQVADEYDITRADVLVACWYAGTYGLPGERRKVLAATRWWRERWGKWAEQVSGALWKSQYDAVPDPLGKDDVQ